MLLEKCCIKNDFFCHFFFKILNLRSHCVTVKISDENEQFVVFSNFPITKKKDFTIRGVSDSPERTKPVAQDATHKKVGIKIFW